MKLSFCPMANAKVVPKSSRYYTCATVIFLRLCVFGEASFVVGVPSPLSLFSLLDGVLASPVPLDHAHHHADENEENHSQEHPDEPLGVLKGLDLAPSAALQVRWQRKL